MLDELSSKFTKSPQKLRNFLIFKTEADNNFRAKVRTAILP